MKAATNVIFPPDDGRTMFLSNAMSDQLGRFLRARKVERLDNGLIQTFGINRSRDGIHRRTTGIALRGERWTEFD
jgi:hypothetical protein